MNRKQTVVRSDYYALVGDNPREQQWLVVPAGTAVRYVKSPRLPRAREAHAVA